jgi:hypothetical protein
VLLFVLSADLVVCTLILLPIGVDLTEDTLESAGMVLFLRIFKTFCLKAVSHLENKALSNLLIIISLAMGKSLFEFSRLSYSTRFRIYS